MSTATVEAPATPAVRRGSIANTVSDILAVTRRNLIR